MSKRDIKLNLNGKRYKKHLFVCLCFSKVLKGKQIFMKFDPTIVKI